MFEKLFGIDQVADLWRDLFPYVTAMQFYGPHVYCKIAQAEAHEREWWRVVRDARASCQLFDDVAGQVRRPGAAA